MIKVKIDARSLIRALKKFSQETNPQLKNGLNRTTRQARTAFLKMLPKELRLDTRKYYVVTGGANRDTQFAGMAQGPPKAGGRGAGYSLTTRFFPYSRSVNLIHSKGTTAKNTSGQLWRSGNGLQAHHNVLSGGGSANLNAKHGFILQTKNGPQAYNRIEGAKYKWGTMDGARTMKTTSPRAVMGQADNPVRKAWETAAITGIDIEIPKSILEAAKRAGFE